jgi:ribonuclease BN (tRNA processing enzyme)
VATALSASPGSAFDAVIVSHAHPDHCADLSPILRARAWSARPLPPLPIYALPGMLDAVLALDRPEVVAGAYELCNLQAGVEVTIGAFTVLTAILPHPRPNLGFRFTAQGRSVVYTGDCGPSDGLVQLAAGADLLLAEASYADDVPTELIGSLSSAADAGRQAAAAGARQLVLTHLMPETDRSRAAAAAARYFAGPIGVARPGLAIDI